MSQTVIAARITDQLVQIVNRPVLIASGSEGVIQIAFEFCSLWEGYGKTAVFYRDTKNPEVYHVPVVQGIVTVPHEVLADEGGFYFGVFGEADNTRTTEVVRLEVKQGAITVATAKPEDPTPDIYHQLIVTYSTIEAQINELIAMRSAGGVSIITVSDGNVEAVITANGAGASFHCSINDSVTLAPGEAYRSDYIIPAEYAPIGTVYGTSSEGIVVAIEPWKIDDDADEENEGKARIAFGNSRDTAQSGYIAGVGVYPLSNISISELVSIRVGYDGTIYPTAGEAVREQARYAIENSGKVKLFRFTGSPGGVCSLGNTNYAELKALYDDQKHIALYCRFSGIGDRYYHCSGASKLNGVIGLAFQFCFGDKSEWVFVGEDDSVQMGTVSSSGVALDDTLTQSGKAADAKAVGDKLGDIETALDSIIEIQNGLIGGGTE